MPKTTPIICNFNAGELDPLLDARSDIQKYSSGCRTLENMVPLVEGSAKRMPGTKYVAEVKSSSSSVRLISFNFSTTQTYVLEFGPLYIRIYKDGAQILGASSEGSDLVTNGTFSSDANWTDKDSGTGISTITGGKLVLYNPYGFPGDMAGREQAITTEAAATYKLYFDCIGGITVRVGTTSGGNDLYEGDFSDVTSQEITFVATGTTTYIGFYTTGFWTNRYVDNAICKKQNSPSAVEVVTTYAETELPSLKFAQSADTLYIVHPAHAPAKLTRSSHTSWTLGSITFEPPPTYEADTSIAATLTLSAVTGTGIDIESDNANTFLASDVDREITCGAGRLVITTVTDGDTAVGDVRVDFASVTLTTGTWYLTGSPVTSINPAKTKKGALGNFVLGANGFRSADVGKYLKLHGGMAIITSYTNETTVKGKILVELQSTDETNYWTLEVTDWSSTRGYPSCITFFENRLCFAGTTYRPSTIWRSNVDDYENFSPDADDDSAADNFTILSGLIDTIEWIVGAESLFAGTASGVWKLSASTSGEAMSATNVSARKQTAIGVKGISPIVVSDALLFVSRSGMVVHQFIYQFDVDKWQCPDMTRISRHITKGDSLSISGINEIAFQAEPYPILWGIRADGQLVGMTYNTSEQVFAWFRVVTDGNFESIAVITREGQEDQVWVITNRTINGNVKRYVEYFMPHEFYSNIENSFFLHCGKTTEYHELIINGGMEADSDWTSLSTPETNERSSTRYYSGRYSRHIVDSTASYGGIYQGVAIVALNIYRVKARIYIDSTTYSSGSVYVILWDATLGAAIGSGFQIVTTRDEWVEVEFETTAGAVVTTPRIYIENLSNTVPCEFYVDYVSVRLIAGVVSGLTHLEGKTVSILADGVKMDNAVVSSGAVTILNDTVQSYASIIHVGLPYTSIVEPMKINQNNPLGTVRGKKQKIDSVTVCVYESGDGIECGPDSDNLLDVQGLESGELTTDDLHHEFSGDWEDEATVYVRQSDPVPLTIRALVPHVSLNEY